MEFLRYFDKSFDQIQAQVRELVYDKYEQLPKSARDFIEKEPGALDLTDDQVDALKSRSPDLLFDNRLLERFACALNVSWFEVLGVPNLTPEDEQEVKKAMDEAGACAAMPPTNAEAPSGDKVHRGIPIALYVALRAIDEIGDEVERRRCPDSV